MFIRHYRKCDPEYGTFQARELIAQIQSIANKYPMEIVMGKKAIEAKPLGISKGDIHPLFVSLKFSVTLSKYSKSHFETPSRC